MSSLTEGGGERPGRLMGSTLFVCLQAAIFIIFSRMLVLIVVVGHRRGTAEPARVTDTGGAPRIFVDAELASLVRRIHTPMQ